MARSTIKKERTYRIGKKILTTSEFEIPATAVRRLLQPLLISLIKHALERAPANLPVARHRHDRRQLVQVARRPLSLRHKTQMLPLVQRQVVVLAERFVAQVARKAVAGAGAVRVPLDVLRETVPCPERLAARLAAM